MAGAGLVAIKRRIKSINNTKKITKAVGLVATSKLRKSRQSLEANNIYYNYFKDIINRMLNDIEDKNNIYIYGNESNKKLYIALTSDAGLCGGFNGNVVTKTVQQISGERENSPLIIVGQKGRMYFKKLGYDCIAEYVEIPDMPTIKEARIIVNKALALYKKGEVGEINIVYTEFISSVKQEVKVRKILPFEYTPVTFEKSHKDYIEYEPESREILKNISNIYLNQTVLNFMLNSKTSEQGARMAAMDGATKNANDLLEKLNLKYNRIRQSVITQEISEIVGGAEAQK
ncbi:ATP synthase F1 subunit gamma [Clostridium ganghwense]|uniref:ATP synthase gamma chain n=1 Tax=Clostridium ganghwense TaxID=312089 RepID=A0ABT4CL94_9CLOT|nr:ATP synthase F1 subunit gamma [Clostridium ganghwense]MCY6369816.1 ATP synthase F1 subunit gamma [Clostridium ganghwense]